MPSPPAGESSALLPMENKQYPRTGSSSCLLPKNSRTVSSASSKMAKAQAVTVYTSKISQTRSKITSGSELLLRLHVSILNKRVSYIDYLHRASYVEFHQLLESSARLVDSPGGTLDSQNFLKVIASLAAKIVDIIQEEKGGGGGNFTVEEVMRFISNFTKYG